MSKDHSREDDDDDDFFANVYGREYEGPPKPAPRPAAAPVATKRAGVSSDDDSEDEGPRDPNALPTDFTSREARGWEAKAKASERHWKRRKEEELNCKICGVSGHFAQGCPLTLGGKRTGEVVDKVLVKDKKLKPRIIGTSGTVIQGLEKESGCKLKVEEPGSDGSFNVRITGPNRMVVIKGKEVVKNFVNKLMEEGGGKRRGEGIMDDDDSRRASNDAHGSGRDGDLRGSDVNNHGGLDEPWRSWANSAGGNSNSESRGRDGLLGPGGPRDSLLGSGPRGEPGLGLRGELGAGTLAELGPVSRGEPGSGLRGDSLLGPFGNYGDRGYSYDKGSPGRGAGSYGGHYVGHEGEGSWRKPERPPQTLEELEQFFLQETLDLTKTQNSEEESEIARHRERMREIQLEHQRRMSLLRQRHANLREEFLTMQTQRRLQAQIQQQEEEHQMYAYNHNRRMQAGMGGALGLGMYHDGYGYGRERMGERPGFSPTREMEKGRYPPLLHDPPHYGLNGVGEGPPPYHMGGRGDHPLLPGGGYSQMDGPRGDPFGPGGGYGYGAGGSMFSSYP